MASRPGHATGRKDCSLEAQGPETLEPKIGAYSGGVRGSFSTPYRRSL
jgi:hypothetical protein